MASRPHTPLAVILAALVAATPAIAPPAFAKKGKSGHARTTASQKKKARIVVAHATTEAKPAAAAPAPILPVPASLAAPAFKVMTRAEILAWPQERLERIGRHLIIGYHSIAQVKALVEKRAIAGIFITDHNVRGRSAAAVRADIDALQEIRKTQGLPPLIVAADQEGGQVSRLSPPLKYQRSLGTLLAKTEHDQDRKRIVEAFAREQAAELARMGITMNFGPVVDLKLDPANRDDGETRLRLRAISSDPYTVAKVAGWYCDVLAETGIMCTLKHFPGLGRVRRDTHVASAEISASEGQLELNDWVPFRRVMAKPNAVTMLGHVRVGVVDRAAPASYSKPIIDGLIRGSWSHEGLLVTDDFSMGAVTRGKPGLGAASVIALNAGVDLLLVSYSERDLDAIMSALLVSDAAGETDDAVRAKSRQRIDRALPPIPAAAAP